MKSLRAVTQVRLGGEKRQIIDDIPGPSTRWRCTKGCATPLCRGDWRNSFAFSGAGREASTSVLRSPQWRTTATIVAELAARSLMSCTAKAIPMDHARCGSAASRSLPPHVRGK